LEASSSLAFYNQQYMINNVQTASSVTPLFYKGVLPITGDENNHSTPFFLQDFAEMCMETVYVLDFLKRGFHFVANNDFFLCGHSVENALLLGYDFYPKVIHTKDLTLLADMHIAILQRLHSIDRPDQINYFSFSVRIKSVAGYIMVIHKLKPIFTDGQLRFGLCLLTSSAFKKPGHLRAYYYNGHDFDEYSSKDEEWKKKTLQPLTEREKTVLILAKHGKTNEEISGTLNIEHQTVRNVLNAIYKKWQVNSIVQAIIYDANHHLIYVPKQRSNSRNHEESPKTKKQRRPITSDKLLYIQESLNKGKSVNSIAKQANVSESAIRYHIDKGRLLKTGTIRK